MIVIKVPKNRFKIMIILLTLQFCTFRHWANYAIAYENLQSSRFVDYNYDEGLPHSEGVHANHNHYPQTMKIEDKSTQKDVEALMPIDTKQNKD